MEDNQDELQTALKDKLQQEISLDVSRGLTVAQLADKYRMTLRQMIDIRYKPEVVGLANKLAEDYRRAARYKLAFNCDLAVKELISFLGLPEISAREEIAAIQLILSIGLVDPEEAAGVKEAIKGGDRKTIDQIRNTLLRIHE